MAEVEEAVHLHPRLAAAHPLRSLLLDANGRPLEAMRAYGEALRLDQQLTEAAEALHEAEAEWEELDESKAEADSPEV